MYSLDARTQSVLYKTHKSRITGPDMIEITIPGFHDLDTATHMGNSNSNQSLRDLCFELKDAQGNNLFTDVDNETRLHETVLQVKKSEKKEVLSIIEIWIKNQFHFRVQWNDASQYDTSTYCLDPKSRALANQLSALALFDQNLPVKPVPSKAIPQKAASTHPMGNAWLDLTKVKELASPPVSTTKSTQEDEATVTTLLESTLQSQSILRSAASKKFNQFGNHLRNLSYRHKKVEAGLECLEISVNLQLNTLFRSFEMHHNCLERLEAAHERQVALQTQHLQLTLDPAKAQQDGTLHSLQKLIIEEFRQIKQDKLTLEQERSSVFDTPHAEDKEVLDRKQRAFKLYDYFHEKIYSTNEQDSEFNINHLSDVSNDETIGSVDSAAKNKEDQCSDKEMPDTQTVSGNVLDTNRQSPIELPQEEQILSSASLAPSHTPQPSTWDSDEEWESPSQLLTQEPWTTTPLKPNRPVRQLKRSYQGKTSISPREVSKEWFVRFSSPPQVTDSPYWLRILLSLY